MFSWWALPVLPDQPVLHPLPFALALAAMKNALTCRNWDTNSCMCCFTDARMQGLVPGLQYVSLRTACSISTTKDASGAALPCAPISSWQQIFALTLCQPYAVSYRKTRTRTHTET